MADRGKEDVRVIHPMEKLSLSESLSPSVASKNNRDKINEMVRLINELHAKMTRLENE